MKVSYSANFWNPESVRRRFWVRVQKSKGCWVWRRSLDRNGYGTVRYGPGQKTGAHRFSWGLNIGPIPNGLFCLHRCDNPSCVRPSHLFLGTQADNVRDMDSKGRRVNSSSSGQGEKNGHAILTEKDVKQIKRLSQQFSRGKSAVRRSEVARRFGVSKAAIDAIVYGYTWKHVQ